MKIARLGLSGALGAVVTIGLLVLMYTLIDAGEVALKEKESVPLANIWEDDQEVEENYKKLNPKKPEPKEPPPPQMPQEAMEMEEVSQLVQMKAPVMDAKLAIATGGFGGDGDARPTKRVQPRYPQRALERGVEGYAIVEFNISINGTVLDPRVVEGMQKTKSGEWRPTSLFNSEAVKAARKLKYKPKTVDSKPVEMIGVRYKFTFELDEDSK